MFPNVDRRPRCPALGRGPRSRLGGISGGPRSPRWGRQRGALEKRGLQKKNKVKKKQTRGVRPQAGRVRPSPQQPQAQGLGTQESDSASALKLMSLKAAECSQPAERGKFILFCCLFLASN